MEGLGFRLREEASLHTLTEDVLKSSEIEGEILDREQVRSSLARRLGIDIGALLPEDRDVEGVVEMMLDATQNYGGPASPAERLFDWHAALFPTARSGMRPIRVGACRDDGNGPMQVVSGPIGKRTRPFSAPGEEMADSMRRWRAILRLVRGTDDDPIPVLKAALAHLWFVTIHPFDDGNGRIARAIADLVLRALGSEPSRF